MDTLKTTLEHEPLQALRQDRPCRFLALCTLLGLLALYIAKSAAGIDLFPGFSLGIWGWINA